MAISLTLILVGLTVVVSWRAFEDHALFNRFLLRPYNVKHLRETYRLGSYMLVHADWVHLGFNMFTLWSFGTFLEGIFTKPQFFEHFIQGRPFWGTGTGLLMYAALYVVGGVAATIPALRKHSDNYSYSAVGASGAVSAVMMAFMILFPTAELRLFFAIPTPAWLGLIIFFGIEHWLSRSGRTNIAHDAHIWGALFGILFVLVLDASLFLHFFQVVKDSLMSFIS